MKTKQFTPVLLVIATLLGACSSMPKTTGLLDQTRNDYRVVQNNPQVGNYAALEMKQASEAMAKANQAADENESSEDIDKLAYLAKQKIALTEEVIKRKTAEAEVTSSAKERDQVRLDQRTMEADQATAEKRQAQGNEVCKNFCVNGHPAGNCHIARSDDDRRKESSTQGVTRQPAG